MASIHGSSNNYDTAPRPTPAASTTITILERRKDIYVLLLAGGKVVTVAATPYNKLKYEHFLGNRISYSFGDGIGTVQETYNDGIFNCTYRDMSMQIRSKDVLAVAILEHMRCMGPSLYESLFREEYEKLHQADLLKYMLAGYRDRVRVVTMAGSGDSRMKEGLSDVNVYIDDGLFKIDAHGNASVLSFGEEDGDNKSEMYRRICIVAHGDIKERSIETPIGPIRMNEQTVTTLAKAMFLLDPDLEDSVFTRQLPPFVLEELKARKQQDGVGSGTASTQTTTTMMMMSVRRLVRAINDAMRRNDTALVHSLVTQNAESARKALEYLPPKHRFFVRNALAQVAGPGAAT
ncbi:MAG TPA: hypothetical protein VF172_11970 [Nitrososphaera sp.]